jgi:hypothetical protein
MFALMSAALLAAMHLAKPAQPDTIFLPTDAIAVASADAPVAAFYSATPSDDGISTVSIASVLLLGGGMAYMADQDSGTHPQAVGEPQGAMILGSGTFILCLRRRLRRTN